MTYNIEYGKHIDRKRMLSLPKSDRIRIYRMIDEKLRNYPEIFGKPLRLSLLGHRSLRVGEYRVIFRIEKNAVVIELIGHRSKIYSEAEKLLA